MSLIDLLNENVTLNLRYSGTKSYKSQDLIFCVVIFVDYRRNTYSSRFNNGRKNSRVLKIGQGNRTTFTALFVWFGFFVLQVL